MTQEKQNTWLNELTQGWPLGEAGDWEDVEHTDYDSLIDMWSGTYGSLADMWNNTTNPGLLMWISARFMCLNTSREKMCAVIKFTTECVARAQAPVFISVNEIETLTDKIDDLLDPDIHFRELTVPGTSLVVAQNIIKSNLALLHAVRCVHGAYKPAQRPKHKVKLLSKHLKNLGVNMSLPAEEIMFFLQIRTLPKHLGDSIIHAIKAYYGFTELCGHPQIHVTEMEDLIRNEFYWVGDRLVRRASGG